MHSVTHIWPRERSHHSVQTEELSDRQESKGKLSLLKVVTERSRSSVSKASTANTKHIIGVGVGEAKLGQR